MCARVGLLVAELLPHLWAMARDPPTMAQPRPQLGTVADAPPEGQHIMQGVESTFSDWKRRRPVYARLQSITHNNCVGHCIFCRPGCSSMPLFTCNAPCKNPASAPNGRRWCMVNNICADSNHQAGTMSCEMALVGPEIASRLILGEPYGGGTLAHFCPEQKKRFN